MKNANPIIRRFLACGLAVIIASTPALSVPPVIREASADGPAGLNFGTILMRQDLGGSYNGVGNSYTSGYREITWDDLPPTSPSQMSEYHNVVSPRGIVINPVQNLSGSIPSLYYSSTNFQNYQSGFQPYSGSTIFSAVALNHLDITFRIPGTKIPASVNGFGAIFSDIDVAGATWVCLYDEAGRLVTTLVPVEKPSGLTLIGATFSDGTRISRVSIRLGSVPIWVNANGGEGGPDNDKVVMDNIFFGEPRAIEHHPSDFDGDGGADYAVFRPSEGKWHVMQSGTNTYRVVQFGLDGDIPTDGDFDGDSRSDMTVFRPSDSTWYSLRSSDGQANVIQFGAGGDKPVAKDYDKDGRTDFAVWRPSDGNYYVHRSSDSQAQIVHWGASGDIPIGAGY